MPTYETLKDGDTCPICNYGKMVASDQRDDDGNSIYLSCNDCESVQMLYLPLPHQDDFHADPAKIKLFAGGYG